MHAHIIENGKITNTIVVDALDAVPGLSLIDADLHPGSIGDSWNGTAVVPHVAAVDRAALGAQIDTLVAQVYTKPMTFSEEYKNREAQAQAFKDAGYTGTVPDLVAGFATPAGMAPQAAADLILQQAASMRGALAQLSNLRMHKYSVANAADDATAVSTFNSTMASIRSIAAQL